MIVNFITSYCFVLRSPCDVSVEISRCKGSISLQIVASLAALYNHKFSKFKFEGDLTQAEFVANVEKGFVSASQPNSY
jgi:hypothetical protein